MYLSEKVSLAANTYALYSRRFDGNGLPVVPEKSAISKAVSSRIVHAVRHSILLLSLNASLLKEIGGMNLFLSIIDNLPQKVSGL
jgi:hypothetical protein